MCNGSVFSRTQHVTEMDVGWDPSPWVVLKFGVCVLDEVAVTLQVTITGPCLYAAACAGLVVASTINEWQFCPLVGGFDLHVYNSTSRKVINVQFLLFLFSHISADNSESIGSRKPQSNYLLSYYL